MLSIVHILDCESPVVQDQDKQGDTQYSIQPFTADTHQATTARLQSTAPAKEFNTQQLIHRVARIWDSTRKSCQKRGADS